MPEQYKILHYRENGKDIFEDWVKTLKDKQGAVAILRLIKRLEKGNFGVHKPCREGVGELVLDLGAGYRIYYSITGRTVILLLCGGTKRTQQKDIDKAVEYLRKYKGEHE